ncbi:MAG: slipin family protein [Anaerolineae bacterium]|nr:slipin family protein [Anaerolineae bacterium]
MATREIIIKDTHRGLKYQDGVLVSVLEAGRYPIPYTPRWLRLFRRQPQVEIVLVDMRERDLTIKGQEILTADKVAIRVSIIVQFQVTDPRAAIHRVENYEDRLYSDVQLAARRSLASMTLEEILTNRNKLSEDILSDVKDAAGGYGVSIKRADVKDLIFPGNLQDIMNRVLTAERLSEAQLVEARTRAETQRIEAEARREIQRLEAQAQAESQRIQIEAAAETKRRAAQSESEIIAIQTEAEIRELREREKAADAYESHPALLRLVELETLRDLARNANARIYVQFDGAGKNGMDEKD